MEKIKINAEFQLGKDECLERKRTTIVITKDGDDVHVGVKAITRVFEFEKNGNLTAHDEQYGDIRTLRMDAPLGCLFDSLKDLFEAVPEIIDNTHKDVKA